MPLRLSLPLQRRRQVQLCKLAGFLLGVIATHLLTTPSADRLRRSSVVAAVQRCSSDSGVSQRNGSLRDSPVSTALDRESRRRGETMMKRVRILCLILTHPKQYSSMATKVNNTWARKCDKHYFVGSTDPDANVSLPLLRLPLVESRRILWKKVRMTFEAVYSRERLEDFDYFFKTDDDTFVLMENLRSLLQGRDPDEPIIYGRRFAYMGNKQQQYMSGGAGYLLSRGALKRLIVKGFGSPKSGGGIDYCNIEFITVEDYLMGRCLTQIGVKFGDSLDESGREKFHPLRPESMANPDWGPDWLNQYNYHPFKQCVTCLSNRTISFHYVKNVLELEFLLYHMRVAK